MNKRVPYLSFYSNALLLSLCLCVSVVAVVFLYSTSFAAAAAGTVTHISGPLFAKKADGTTRVLSKGSAVESGDIIVTEKSTYARIKFTDNSEMTLRPNTQIKIANYNYDKAKPKEDAAVYDLAKGGLRAITGSVGKRGNPDSYKLSTPTATVGIRGTDYIALFIPPRDSASLGSVLLGLVSPGLALADIGGGLNPGLYVQVLDGSIHVSNGGGTQNFTAGQFGFTPSFQQPPVILPSNPGMQFSPPPSFNTGGSGQQKGGGTNSDCVVR